MHRARDLPVHVIRFAGYLDIGRYPEFRETFAAVPPGTPVLVDLVAVTGVDSTFLSELLLFRRRHRPTPVVVAIAPHGRVMQVFALANLTERIDVFGSFAEARLALEAALD